MNNKVFPRREKCPRCGGWLPDTYPGALSRVDNRTEICSPCGTAEALEDFTSALKRAENIDRNYTGWVSPPKEGEQQ